MSTAISPVEGSILTVDQAATYLAIPKATLYTWRTRRVGFGPRAVKIGGCLRYRRVDLDSWVAEHLEPLEPLEPVIPAAAPTRLDAQLTASVGA